MGDEEMKCENCTCKKNICTDMERMQNKLLAMIEDLKNCANCKNHTEGWDGTECELGCIVTLDGRRFHPCSNSGYEDEKYKLLQKDLWEME
jgi:hypothetical protein